MNDKNSQVLVIDDEPAITALVGAVLREDGWQVTEVGAAEQAFEVLRDHDWAAVFCDVQLGGADGFSVLRRFKAELPSAKVVLMTGHGTAEGALDATSFGAYDYLLKPFGADDLQSLSRALHEQLEGSKSRRMRLSGGVSPYQTDIGVLGRSEAFIAVMKKVGRVAGTNLPVLFIGQAGTRKEIVVTSLARRSSRGDPPFFALDFGAKTPAVVLFGFF